MSDRTPSAEHPRALSPLVEAVRLENAIWRKRRQVEKLAAKLQDLEFERQVFERELARVKLGGAPATSQVSSVGVAATAMGGHEVPAQNRQPVEQPSDPATGTTRREPPETAIGWSTGAVVDSVRGAAGLAHPSFRDETGRRYGALTVVSRARNMNGNARWHCRCDRGHETIVEWIRLRRDGEKVACPACSGKTPPTCSFCGASGHTQAGCSERPGTSKHRHVQQGPRRDSCRACFSMPSRVSGSRCSECGLDAEPALRATDFTSSGTTSLGGAK